jgi:WD40 repeat protein
MRSRNQIALAVVLLVVASRLEAQEKTGTPAADGTKPVLPPTARRLEGHKDWVTGLAFSPDGTKLASVSWNERVQGAKSEGVLWDLSTGKQVFVFPGASNAVAFSPDGRMLATLVDDHYQWTVCFWDVATGGKLRTLKHSKLSIMYMAFSPGSTHQILTIFTGRLEKDK